MNPGVHPRTDEEEGPCDNKDTMDHEHVVHDDIPPLFGEANARRHLHEFWLRDCECLGICRRIRTPARRGNAPVPEKREWVLRIRG